MSKIRNHRILTITIIIILAAFVESWAFLSQPNIIVESKPFINENPTLMNPLPLRDDKVLLPNKEAALKEETVTQEEKLQIELLGTAIGNIKDPIAFIKDLETGKQGICKLGTRVRGAKVMKIEVGAMVLEKDNLQITLKLSKRGRAWANLDDNSPIISISGNEIVLSRDKLINQSNDILNAISFVKVKPHYQDNKVVGLAVEGIAQDSIIAAAGIQNKDIVRMVNDQKINSYQKALIVASKLQNQSEFKVGIIRNGRMMNLCYKIAK